MTPTYSTLFDKSWNAIKENLPLVAGLSLVYAMGLAAICSLPFMGGFLTGPFTAGYMVCLLKLRKKQEIGYADVFWGFLNFNRFLQLLLAGFLVGLITGAGLICLLVPGIWFVVASSFTTAYLVLDDTDAITAIKKSMTSVKGHWWFVLGLLILVGILHIAGAICFIVGLLIAAPLATLMILTAAEAMAVSPQKNEDPSSASGPSVLTVNPS